MTAKEVKRQIRSDGHNGRGQPQLSALRADFVNQPLHDGAGRSAQRSTKRRPKGPRAAYNRYRQLLNSSGRELPPHLRALLLLTARDIIHAENISGDMYAKGELRADGEPRVLLTRYMDLQRLIAGNLRFVFGEVGGDSFADLARLMAEPAKGPQHE